MGFTCKIFGHKWNGCKCERCGTSRDERHNWNGCKCERCGAIRKEGHNWNGCKCEQCGAMRKEGHNYVLLDNCTEKCSICGKVYEKHKWVLLENNCIEKCFICGEVHILEHKWNRCKCEHCGAIRDKEHKWNNGKCSHCGSIDEKTAIKELLAIFPRYPLDYAGHETFDNKHKKEICAIGEALNKKGGMRSMREVGEDFAKQLPIHARKLETMWNGIGDWRG